MEKDDDKIDGRFMLHLALICIAVLFLIKAVVSYFPDESKPPSNIDMLLSEDSVTWIAPGMNTLDNSAESKRIKYGRDLIANTSTYLGPNGRVKHISNGMNCQNCHLDAGTKIFGNNYSAVASSYPKFRERSGSVESVCKRINDCLERSLNGSALDTLSDEMQAMKAYILWLGKDMQKGKKAKGAGIKDLTYLQRAADPVAGKNVYSQKCQSCHKKNGDGVFTTERKSYQYPPLWGAHSYNSGAGLFRLSRLAGYVKYNMPLGSSYDAPELSDEEAWDVAAYINSQPRPSIDLSKDWPKIEGKPVDHPFGPYTDTFSEAQHKYGPLGPIAEFRGKLAKSK
jgi:thiosulfate dehydrogenase